MRLLKFIKSVTSKESNTNNVALENIKLSISIETNFDEEEYERFIPIRMKLNGYKCLSGGYQSWSIIHVEGVSKQGRRRSSWYECATEDIALCKAREDGIIDPYVSEIVPHDLPTEKQIAYANDLNIEYPSDVTKRDLSTLISRVTDYPTDEIMPTEEFGLYALRQGVHFCLFASETQLLSATLFQSDMKTKARFYAYVQLCNEMNRRIENIDEFEFVDVVNEFAEFVLNDDSLIKSLNNTSTIEFLKPNKRTKINKTFRALLIKL